MRSGKDNYGFNAASGAYEDLVAAGVIDPAKVDSLGSAERQLDRGIDADDRGDDLRDPREEAGWRRRWRRDGLLVAVSLK